MYQVDDDIQAQGQNWRDYPVVWTEAVKKRRVFRHSV
jgi:hypothetical protein